MLLADSFIERNGTAILAILAIITIVVAGVTVFLMWWWRRQDRQSKTLDYRVISDVSIITSHNRPQKLKVVYGPAENLIEINDPRVTEIKFKNTGKQVITATSDPDTTDFLEPMVITRQDSRIVDFDVVEESAGNLYDKIEHVVARDGKPEYVQLFPKTLNPRDWLTVQIVYDGGEPDCLPEITGRIRGETRSSEVFMLDEERERGLSSGLPRTPLDYLALFVIIFLCGGVAMVLSSDMHGAVFLIGVFLTGVGVIGVFAVNIADAIINRKKWHAALLHPFK